MRCESCGEASSSFASCVFLHECSPRRECRRRVENYKNIQLFRHSLNVSLEIIANGFHIRSHAVNAEDCACEARPVRNEKLLERVPPDEGSVWLVNKITIRKKEKRKIPAACGVGLSLVS
eukprot:Gregarina_sp_Poly_1__10484@NODE_766_length_6375_cov_28_411382_g563_i0_p4_GENE_NODE_766_length_6375_cov_28_411382_g563_i0NODE_766_length_6375_cov_28_411382_g563_i0_p4_ORF_typecomplete_len120_score14_20_NODE_766_length_6375_cov_28_411382_g563_i036724031